MDKNTCIMLYFPNQTFYPSCDGYDSVYKQFEIIFNFHISSNIRLLYGPVQCLEIQLAIILKSCTEQCVLNPSVWHINLIHIKGFVILSKSYSLLVNYLFLCWNITWNENYLIIYLLYPARGNIWNIRVTCIHSFVCW